MNKFVPYLLIALIIGAFVYQQHTITDLSEKLGESSEKITQLESKQKSILTDIDNYKIAKKEFDDKKIKLETENRKLKSDLDSKKGRESTITKRPSLVEKQLNESFKQAADKLSCNTGATERCAN